MRCHFRAASTPRRHCSDGHSGDLSTAQGMGPGAKGTLPSPKTGGYLRGAVFLQLQGLKALCTLPRDLCTLQRRAAGWPSEVQILLQSTLHCGFAQAPCKGANTSETFAPSSRVCQPERFVKSRDFVQVEDHPADDQPFPRARRPPAGSQSASGSFSVGNAS
jgi:hypothetical protein